VPQIPVYVRLNQLYIQSRSCKSESIPVVDWPQKHQADVSGLVV
jgi:hypothetical protein